MRSPNLHEAASSRRVTERTRSECDGTTRSVQRALLVLRTMNRKEIWSLQELQVVTGLPKTTVHRILGTLQAEHYVYSGADMHGYYRLTQDVRHLSSGYVEKNRLADIAAPLVIAATKKSRWPMAVGVIDGMEVRANVCTMPYSPYSMRPTCFGHRYDLLATALGTAYLAFCAPRERRILMNLVRASRDHATLPTPNALRTMLRTIRKRGYGMRAGTSSGESSAIAVPIHSHAGELVGVLACSTFAHSLDDDWIARNLVVVRDVAARITQLYR